jgi:hypothetical protein
MDKEQALAKAEEWFKLEIARYGNEGIVDAYFVALTTDKFVTIPIPGQLFESAQARALLADSMREKFDDFTKQGVLLGVGMCHHAVGYQASNEAQQEINRNGYTPEQAIERRLALPTEFLFLALDGPDWEWMLTQDYRTEGDGRIVLGEYNKNRKQAHRFVDFYGKRIAQQSTAG